MIRVTAMCNPDSVKSDMLTGPTRGIWDGARCQMILLQPLTTLCNPLGNVVVCVGVYRLYQTT